MKSTAIKILLFITVLFCLPILWTYGIVGNYGDVYYYAAPFRYFSKINLFSGIIPLWNPCIFAGSPFLASPQSALFYSGSNLFYFLPLNYAFNLFCFFHLFINALGMYCFMLSIQNNRSAALLGSVIWSFSFLFLSKLTAGHVIHLSGYSWIPYILLFFNKMINESGSNTSWAFFMFLMTSLLQFFSGHIQVWLLTALMLPLIYFRKIVLLDGSSARKSFAVSIGYFGFAFTMLSMIQSFPTFTFIANSSRALGSELLSLQNQYEFATSYSMEWKNLMNLMIPNFFGTPMNHTFVDPQHPSTYFECFALYVGWIPLLLALGGIYVMIQKKRYLIPIFLVVSIVMATGRYGPIYPWAWKCLSALRVPARFYLWTLLAMVLSATMAWNIFTKDASARTKFILIGLVLLDLYFMGRQFIYSEDPSTYFAKSKSIEWLQTTGDLGYKNLRICNYRIFTAGEIGNHNKSMFFNLSNMNGYEAVLQNSLMRFFLVMQPGAEITSTGIDFSNPEHKIFNLLAVKYLMTLKSLPIHWPIAYSNQAIKIYNNPQPTLPMQAFFNAQVLPGHKDIFIKMKSDAFVPTHELLVMSPEVAFSSVALNMETDLAMGEIKSNPPYMPVQLINFSRINANRIECTWKSSKPGPFWIFLSEAYYPGWEVWTENHENFTTYNPRSHQRIFEADGYFQSIFFQQSQTPYEKLYWIFRPLDFRIGAWITPLSLLFLFIVAIRMTVSALLKLK